MAYVSASQGGYGSGPTVIHTDASQADVVSISDAELLFTGHLERKGPDLILTGHDGHGHIIPDYFSAEHPAALVAPNGARIAGDLVELLAGSQAPGQYAQDAQAQAPAPTNAIGRIEKVVGNVTVMRNGVAVALHVGDAVYKNDVVQTGADSSAGIGFPDGTALNLVSNTRMALNDYVYDPNGTSNDALFNLVQGGFAFVAGKVAHTGDMKIGTPVATMGIRGTTGYALQQVATVSANAGNVTMSFAVVADPGSDRVGAYVLIDQFGNEVAVDRAGIWTTLSWDGGNRPPTVSRAAMTASNFAIEQALVPALVQILNNINNLTPNPQSGPNNPGSSTPPLFELINLQQYLQQNGNTQQTIINIQNGGANTNSQTQLPATFTIVLGASATSVVTWTSPVSGTWETGSNWSDLSTPGAPEYVNIAQPVKVTVEGSESADGLRIGAGAILNLASGATLEVSQGIADFGTLRINSSGSDPKLAINGTVYLLNNGTLAMVGPSDENLIIGVAGTDAKLVNVNNTITGSGTIGQGDGALTLVNGKNGTIEATPLLASDSGLLIIDTGNRVSNSGTMTAAAGGTLEIADDVRNLGLILAQAESSVVLLHDRIGNHAGVIKADGAGSAVDLEKAHIFHGTLETSNGGVIETTNGRSSFLNVSIADGSIIDTHQFSSLDLRGTTTLHGTVTFEGNGTFELHRHATIVGGSQAELDNYGAIIGFGNIGGGDQNFVLVNEQSGIINANGQLTLTIDNDSPGSASAQPSNAVINTGIVEATGSGGLAIVNTTISNASDAGHNTGVVDVAAGSQITLDNATILHGSVTIAPGGEMQTTSGTANTIDTAEGQDNLSTLTLINAGTLLVNDDSSLTLASPYAIDNSGTIQLSSTGDATYLYFDQADAGINGGGHIILSASTANIIAVTQSGDQLTNFDNTISGAGAIGTGGMVLVNDGVINADQQSAALTLDPAFLENTGAVEATTNATLVLSNTTVSNSSAATEAGGSYSFNNAIDDPAAVSITAPSGINDAGQIVGTYFSGGKSNGFLHDGSNYITLDDPAATGGTSANAINDSGEVVGTYSAGGTQSGFVFSNGTYVTLNDPLGADGTLANGIDNAGQIVGKFLDARGSTHGFLFGSGTYTTIDDPLGINGTNAKGINDAGEIVGYYLDGSSVAHGFLYNNGTYVTVNDPLAANGTFAEGINNAGQVVGYYLDSSDVAHGFVYSNGKYFNFDDSAAGKGAGEGTFAFAIDNAGRVSGYYVGNGFEVAGFFAKPTQSPTSGSIFADSGATVDLVGTSVVGGNLTTAAATNTSAAGVIDVTGNAISAIYDATVSNSGALGIEQGSQLDVSGTALTSGSLSVAGILDSIGTGSIGSEAITVTGILEATGDTLTIDSGSSIANYNELLATSDGTIVLVGLTVTNAGTVQVDAPDAGQIAKIVLEDATISGGTVNIYGTLNSTGTSFITDAAIANTGTINATAGTLTINDPVSFSNTGTIEATNGATLLIDPATITNAGGAIMVSGADSVVQLADTMIDGGAIDDGGTLSVIADSEIENAKVHGGGDISVASGQTLTLHTATLDNVMISGNVSNTATLTVDHMVTLNGATVGGGTITNNGALLISANSAIENATLNDGQVTVASGQTLTLDGDTVTNTTFTDTATGATFSIDNGTTLSLSGVTINSGTVNDGTAAGTAGGHITITGSSAIKDAQIDDGQVTVASGQTLMLDGDAVTGATFTDTASGAILSIDNGATLSLSGVTIDAGTVNDGTSAGTAGGHITIGASSTIENATFNDGQVTVAGGQTLDLDNVMASGSTISLEPQAFSFTSLNDPSAGPHYFNPGVDFAAINDAGNVLGYYWDAKELSHGFVYSNGGYTDLTDSSAITLQIDPPGLYGTDVLAINDAGVVVGYYTNAYGANHGFIYSNGTYSNLGDPSANVDTLAGGFEDTYPLAINNAGQVAGYYIDSNAESDHGFIYSNGTYTTLNDPLAGQGYGEGTRAVAINNFGVVVGVYGDASGEHGFIYGNGTYTTLNDPLAAYNSTSVQSINDAGVIIGTYINTDHLDQGFVYSNGIFTALQDPGAVETIPLAINDAGEVAGYYTDDRGVTHGFLYSNGTYTNLDYPSATIGTEITAINNAGQIAGVYIGNGGVNEFVADPTTLILSNGSTETGGALLVGALDTVEVESSGATLDGVSVTNNGCIQVDAGLSPTTILTLEDGTTIDGGTIADGGTLSVSTSSEIDSATIDGGGNITVASAKMLTLDNVTLDEVTLSGSFSNTTTLTIDDTVTLDGARIDSGTIDDTGTLSVTASSKIESATINGGGDITVASGKTLTLDTVTFDNVTLSGSYSNTATLAIDDTVTLNGATLDGGTIDNNGAIVAAASTASTITGNLTGTGNLEIGRGATLELGGTSTNVVVFEGHTGTLDLGQPSTFAGEIAGFTGTAPNASDSDVIDLAGINYNSPAFSESYDSTTGVLSVTDGTNSALLSFVGFTGTFQFASDGGGGTDIFDPPVKSSGASVSPDNDTFVFHPGMGTETVTNFHPKADTIELDHFANIESAQQLASHITGDVQGDAVIALGHHDSITLPGMSANYLQAHLSSLVHLH